MLVLIVSAMKELLRLMTPGLAAGVTRSCIEAGFSATVACRRPRRRRFHRHRPRQSTVVSGSFSLPHLRPANRTTNPYSRYVGWVIERGLANLRANPCGVRKRRIATPLDRGEGRGGAPSSAFRRRTCVSHRSSVHARSNILIPAHATDCMNRIALVMIVRDEARSLERCLESARPWVDETVVLDTGSLDATPEIARRLGARVAHFAWIDDFAAARNAALALTDAPWRLVLDADEWITHGGESLAALRRRGRRVHRPDQRRQPVRRCRRQRRPRAELAAARPAARRALRRPHPRAARVGAAAPAPAADGRARRLPRRAEGEEGRAATRSC